MTFLNIFSLIMIEFGRMISFLLNTNILGFKYMYLIIGMLVTGLAFRLLGSLINVTSAAAGGFKVRSSKERKKP